MHVINGKYVRQMDAAEVAAWAAPFQEIAVDIGAGDGRFVRRLTRERPDLGAIAVDICEANLRPAARATGRQALFVVADGRALPAELHGLATHLTLYFPWGSLLRGLVVGDASFLAGFTAVAQWGATVDIAVNAGALAACGLTLESGAERIASVLRDAGARIGTPTHLGAPDLRHLPTTWAKRLAFGRDPRAIRIAAAIT